MSSENEIKITSSVEIARNWLKQSLRYLKAAKECIKTPEASLTASQLAAEQALKSCFYVTFTWPDIERNKELQKYFYTHSHEALRSRLPPEIAATEKLQEACRSLSGLLERTRYPTPPWGIPPCDIFTDSDAEKGIACAELVIQFAATYVKEVSEAISRCGVSETVEEEKK